MQLNDKANFALLRAAIETALTPVAEHHGLKIKTGHLGYESDGSACKVTLDIEKSDALPKEERQFIQYNHFFADEGLKPEHLHQSFKFNRETVEIIGLRPAAIRFPLVVRNNTTGKRFCVGCKLVRPAPQPQIVKGGLVPTKPPTRTLIALVFAFMAWTSAFAGVGDSRDYCLSKMGALDGEYVKMGNHIALKRLSETVTAMYVFDKTNTHAIAYFMTTLGRSLDGGMIERLSQSYADDWRRMESKDDSIRWWSASTHLYLSITKLSDDNYVVLGVYNNEGADWMIRFYKSGDKDLTNGDGPRT